MNRLTSVVLCSVSMALAACSAARYETVTYPPRVDLTKHELIGVIEFASPDQRDLAPLVTSRFIESARSDQGMVRIVTLREGARPDAARMRELAKQHGLRTLVVGDLRVSKVRPSVSVSESLSSASVSGSIEATLAVEMFEPETGASVWSASGRTRETVGGVTMNGVKDISFGGTGKESAYAGMLDALVSQVTRDMHGTWERRRVP